MKFPGQHWDFTGLHHLKILQQQQQQQHWYLTYHIYISTYYQHVGQMDMILAPDRRTFS